VDIDAYIATILGEEAVQCAQWGRVGVWVAMGLELWPPLQATAYCQAPCYMHDTGLVEVCRTVAGIDALGRHVCEAHRRILWTCMGCGGFLPAGMSGYCSPACTRADHGTATWLGKWLGARYTTPEEQAP
jgi:hypothetical protein